MGLAKKKKDGENIFARTYEIREENVKMLKPDNLYK